MKKPTKMNDKQYDVEEYSYKSDDYEVVKVGIIKWYDVVE